MSDVELREKSGDQSSTHSRELSRLARFMVFCGDRFPGRGWRFTALLVGIAGAVSAAVITPSLLGFIIGSVLGAIALLTLASVVSADEEVEDHLYLLFYGRHKGIPDRLRALTKTLDEATALMGELQQDLDERSARVMAIARREAEAEERAQHATLRASMSEEAAKAMDEFLGRRINELEESARRREWVIGTVVAVCVAVFAVPIAHFLFHY